MYFQVMDGLNARRLAHTPNRATQEDIHIGVASMTANKNVIKILNVKEFRGDQKVRRVFYLLREFVGRAVLYQDIHPVLPVGVTTTKEKNQATEKENNIDTSTSKVSNPDTSQLSSVNTVEEELVIV